MNVLVKTGNYIKNKYHNYKSTKLIGQGCINLIDVGSAGILPSPWLENPDKIGRLLKFEPRIRELSNDSVKSFDIALAGENGIRNLYIYKGYNGTGSSFYEQNFKYVRDNFEQLKLLGPKSLALTWFERSLLDHVEQVTCSTLDSTLEQLEDEVIYNFLKIDAQGAEYEILTGAEEFLKTSCIGLHLELFTLPLYKDIMLFDEVEEYLGKYGFVLKKKYPPHGSFDSQNDCLFLKENTSDDIIETIESIYNI